MKEVRLKNLHTAACVNLNYVTTKQKPKMYRWQMVEFIKTCDEYLCKFNFGHMFSSIVLPLSAEEK